MARNGKQLLLLEKERRRRERVAKMRQYADDPVGYARDIIGMTMTPDQEELANRVVKHRRVACKASHSIGKCLEHTERLPLSDGRLVEARELVGRFFGVTAWCEKTGDKKIEIAFAEDNGVHPVFRVTTHSGRSIVRTGNHPLWSGRVEKRNGHPRVVDPGWVATQGLKVGDPVLVPLSLPCRGVRTAPEDHVKLLGYLLGDGGTTASVTFTQKDGVAKDEFIEIIERLGCRARHSNELTVGVSGADDSMGMMQAGRNPVLNLAREWGVLGKKAVDKRFPDWVWELPDDQLALFLNRLFSCDGWSFTQEKRNIARIGICLASEVMVRDVEMAMLRLGISGRLRHKPSKCDGKEFDAWEWVIYTGPEIVRFAEKVGILGKEAAVARAVEVAGRLDQNKTRKWRERNAPEGYRWDTVNSIEPLGDRPTVAICVPQAGTYLTTFVEHNTYLAALMANWWFDTDEQSIVYITAPTWHQALNLTFKQIKLQRMRRGLPGIIQETGIIKDESKLLAPVHYIKAINAETGEGIQGEHSAKMLLILEEAVGVPPYVWEAMNGLMTDRRNRQMAVFNPTDEATTAGEISRSTAWSVMTIRALDHPNVAAELRGDPLPFPGAVDLNWVWENIRDNCEPGEDNDPSCFPFWSLSDMENALNGIPLPGDANMKWWRPNAIFEGRALGRFPGQAFEQVIPRAWLEDLPRLQPDIATLPEIGVDSARHGDDRTVLAVRQGGVVHRLTELRQLDQDYVLRHVRETIRYASGIDGARYDEFAIRVRFDVTGGLGTGPADTLANEGYSVEAVNSSESAHDEDQYPNRRSELWFSCRNRARTRELDLSRLDPDARERLVRELSTPKWSPDKKGRKTVEDKATMKKRLGWSPDLADAVNLAFAGDLAPREINQVDVPELSRRWV